MLIKELSTALAMLEEMTVLGTQTEKHAVTKKKIRGVIASLEQAKQEAVAEQKRQIAALEERQAQEAQMIEATKEGTSNDEA